MKITIVLPDNTIFGVLSIVRQDSDSLNASVQTSHISTDDFIDGKTVYFNDGSNKSEDTK